MTTATEILQSTTDRQTRAALIAERDGGRDLSEMAAECAAAYPDAPGETSISEEEWIEAIRGLRA